MSKFSEMTSTILSNDSDSKWKSVLFLKVVKNIL